MNPINETESKRLTSENAPDSGKTCPSDESAPEDSTARASGKCRGIWSPAACKDPSRPKHRFMAALLGKIRSPQKPEDNDTSPNQALAEAGLRAAKSTDPNHRQLEDTQPSHSPSPMTFTYAPGSKPLPQYTIRRGIGVGGFGEVYFATSEAGKEVAIKRIQRNLDVEVRGASQCLNLKHTNLVALYDICHDSAEQAWVVMEYVPGLNLRQILDQNHNGLSEPGDRRRRHTLTLRRVSPSRLETRQRV